MEGTRELLIIILLTGESSLFAPNIFMEPFRIFSLEIKKFTILTSLVFVCLGGSSGNTVAAKISITDAQIIRQTAIPDTHAGRQSE